MLGIYLICDFKDFWKKGVDKIRGMWYLDLIMSTYYNQILREVRDLIKDNSFVYVRDMHGIYEFQYMGKMNRDCPIQVLDGSSYLVKATGEIKAFEIDEDVGRSNSYKSLRRTFRQLRYLINNNFVGAQNELFVTLTYGGDDRPRILDGGKRFYMDFQIYIKALRRKYGRVEFINVVEPHEDGYLHAHVLLKFFDHDSIFIPNDDMQNVYWKRGFTKTSNLVGVTNIGAYLSAYLSDVELTDSAVNDCLKAREKIEVKEVSGKKYIKGARLKYYPKKFNIYRRSRGIIDPVVHKGFAGEFKKKIGILGREPDFIKKYEIEVNDFSNTIIYEHFNLR